MRSDKVEKNIFWIRVAVNVTLTIGITYAVVHFVVKYW